MATADIRLAPVLAETKGRLHYEWRLVRKVAGKTHEHTFRKKSDASRALKGTIQDTLLSGIAADVLFIDQTGGGVKGHYALDGTMTRTQVHPKAGLLGPRCFDIPLTDTERAKRRAAGRPPKKAKPAKVVKASQVRAMVRKMKKPKKAAKPKKVAAAKVKTPTSKPPKSRTPVGIPTGTGGYPGFVQAVIKAGVAKNIIEAAKVWRTRLGGADRAAWGKSAKHATAKPAKKKTTPVKAVKKATTAPVKKKTTTAKPPVKAKSPTPPVKKKTATPAPKPKSPTPKPVKAKTPTPRPKVKTPTPVKKKTTAPPPKRKTPTPHPVTPAAEDPLAALLGGALKQLQQL